MLKCASSTRDFHYKLRKNMLAILGIDVTPSH